MPKLNNLAHLFGCGVESVVCLPSAYLDLPLGAIYKCKMVWEPVVERFQTKLAGSKSKLLSRGGRLLSLIHI